MSALFIKHITSLSNISYDHETFVLVRIRMLFCKMRGKYVFTEAQRLVESPQETFVGATM